MYYIILVVLTTLLLTIINRITSNCIQLLVQDSESACVTAFNVMVKVHYVTALVVGTFSIVCIRKFN